MSTDRFGGGAALSPASSPGGMSDFNTGAALMIDDLPLAETSFGERGFDADWFHPRGTRLRRLRPLQDQPQTTHPP